MALSRIIGGGFFLLEGERAIFVHSNDSKPLEAGDEVEAPGFAQTGVFSAVLADATFQVSGHVEAPDPVVADSKILASGACDAQLVQLDALEGHFGIRGMKERAGKIGAALQIKSETGKGTRVELTLALPKPRA